MLFVKWNFAEGHGWLEACFGRMTHFVLNPLLWILGLDAESPNSGDHPSVLCALFLCHQVLPAAKWIRLAWTGNYGWASGIQLEVILVLFASCQTSSSYPYVFFLWLCMFPGGTRVQPADWCGPAVVLPGVQDPVLMSALMQIHHHTHATISDLTWSSVILEVPFSAWAPSTGMSSIPCLEENWGKVSGT